MKKIFFFSYMISTFFLIGGCFDHNKAFEILQPKSNKPELLKFDEFQIKSKVLYIPATIETIKWGYLPNRNDEPVAKILPGSYLVVDSISHEGILEDQGRDPVNYFSSFGIKQEQVLKDVVSVAKSNMSHDFHKDGPHIVVGPVEIIGAMPGDILKVRIIDVIPRVPYGIISNRHGKGALPGEFPLGPKPDRNIQGDYRNISIFSKTFLKDEKIGAYIEDPSGKRINFDAKPFMGIIGVAKNSSKLVHSVPPGKHGGNLDINELYAGSTLYIPVQVPGAMFYTGDPHLAQGDGEVALTALEQSLRALFKIDVIKKNSNITLSKFNLQSPFAENKKYWIPIGLDEDLDTAMKNSVRQGIDFLSFMYGIEKQTALAYMSAATTFEVSQVVDKTKGIHGLIAKKDFETIRP
ncbi:MAG: acetamidase [Betaproteobacteria bacterium TMED156]|nr:MAG: acetamidase [Betaproteobacteria bacterium TMED156]